MSKQNQIQHKKESERVQAKVASVEQEAMETAVSSPIHATLQRAYTDPSDINPNDARTLQRTIGNQAMRRLVVQRKMTVGPAGDKYEQEADAVARQVVQTINTPIAPPVQRHEEEEEVQMKPFPSATPSPTISMLQRQEEEEEVQMKPSSLDGGDLSPDIEGQIQSAKGGGLPLSTNTQSSMGQAFNADFSGVKVHTDSQSDSLNRSISARAFTTGNDIFFRGGEYNPNSSGGQTLLAHELTHVVQQGGAPSSAGVQRKKADNSIQRWGIKSWLKKKSKKKKEDSSTTEPTTKPTTEKAEKEEAPVDASLNDAVEYERNLGRYAFNHSKAGSGALAMINKMSNAMLKDFDKEDEEQRKKLAELYGRDSINSAGQVGTEFDAVWGAITEGNLREKLTALYNAMYGPFKTYLTQAMKEKSWGEMEEKGLNVTKLKRRKRQMKTNLGAKDLYRDPGNPLDRKKYKSFEHVGKTRFKKDETSDRTVGDLEQGKNSIGLSDREKAYQFGQEQEESGDISNEKLKWKEGGSYWGVNKKNKWVKKIENSMHMPVVAGPSGSMLRMFQLWEFLNKPVDAAQWRLAVLGWMLSSNDHSFHEMMMTAADFGLPYKPGQLAYMEIAPLTVWELRDNVAKESLFPHELAFKRKASSGGFNLMSPEDLEDASNELDDIDSDEKGAVSAPAAAMIKLYAGFGYLLLNPTKEGGMLLKKKVTHAINSKDELAHIKKGIEDGEYTVDDLIRETKEMMPVMESALDMIPDWSGNLFRGTGTFNPWSYRVGSTFSFGKFGSSTLDESVAKEFADDYNIGPYKYILKMKVSAGKDIRSFSDYGEDEILLPPGSKFKVNNKSKVGKYTYVEMDQIGRGGNLMNLGQHVEPVVEDESVEASPSLTYYRVKGSTEPYGVITDVFEAMYIDVDHEDGEWTEFNYMLDGSYYWAKTNELNAFINPPETVTESETIEEDPKPDPKFAKVPEIKKNVTYNAGKKVMASKLEDQERNIEVTFVEDPSEETETEIPLRMFKIICTDELRLKGIAHIQPAGFGARSYYVGLGDLYNLDSGEPKVGDIESEAPISEAPIIEDSNFGLPSSFNFNIISMLQAGGDPEMLTSMGMMDESVFTSLTDNQVAALAKVMGISKENIEEQISDL